MVLRPGKSNSPASTVRATVMQTSKDLSGPCTLSYRVTNKGYWRREVRVQIVGDDLMCRATNKQCKSGHWVWQSASSDIPYLILVSHHFYRSFVGPSSSLFIIVMVDKARGDLGCVETTGSLVPPHTLR